MPARPKTQYAESGEALIAYQVLGDGPIDLVLIEGSASHVDLQWENPLAAGAYERLASFSRLIRFDPRGTGLSEPVEHPPTLEQQVADLMAVMEAAGSERIALCSGTDAGLGAMLAGTRPERVSHLILWGVAARGDHFLRSPERLERYARVLQHDHWSEGSLLEEYAPSRVGDPRFEEWWVRYQRAICGPTMARRIFEFRGRVDVTGILPAIRVPTLVLHRSGDTLVPIELARELAGLIPNSRFVELPGTDNYFWASETEPLLDAVEEFVTGSRTHSAPDRVLATLLFTDIVDSTGHAARLGDSGWRRLLEQHDAIVRAQVERWRGRELDTAGDGFLASFDGPARAVRCAEATVEEVAALGVEIRAGVHTGECERIRDGLGGMAVHIGARVAARAGGGEVLVSRTVKDLVVGSGLSFVDRGVHELKGVPDKWRLFALEAADGVRTPDRASVP